MANWITHTIIADLLFERYSDLDGRGFCVGNVAPDCNMPNKDWTSFIPTREVTHFMDGKDKLSSRYDLFFDTYIKDRSFASHEEYSFLLGYYAHLIADAEYLRFCRHPAQLHRTFERIREHSEMWARLEGKEENFMSLKNAFGKKAIFSDITAMENTYLQRYPDCSYNRILRNIHYFPNYLNFFPENYYAEKIRLMLAEYDKTADEKGSGYCFFTKEEYGAYLMGTVDLIDQSMKNLQTREYQKISF